MIKQLSAEYWTFERKKNPTMSGEFLVAASLFNFALMAYDKFIAEENSKSTDQVTCGQQVPS